MVHQTVEHGPQHPLLDRLAEHWWLVLLRGIAAIVFGALAMVAPGSALLVLLVLFGAYAFCDGVIALSVAFAGNDEGTPTWWLVVIGALGMFAGIVTFGWPDLTGAVLMFTIGGWALLAGVVQIMGAIELRKEIRNEWLLLASGAASVIFGLLVISFPSSAAVTLIWTIAAFALIFGGMWTVLALRLRGLARSES